jgi:predicted hydrocarbon binding protein
VKKSLQESLEKTEKTGFVISFDAFGVFKSALDEIFSPSAASVILQSAANRCGREACRKIQMKIKDKVNVLAYLAYLKESMNWGKISFKDVNLENGTGKIKVLDSFESLAGKYTQPCCHFLSGFLAGFLSELLGRNISVTEVTCAGKGDAHCEFELKFE